ALGARGRRSARRSGRGCSRCARGLRICGCGIDLLLVLDDPKPHYILLVLLVSVGKCVRASTVSHEVEFLSTGRIGRGLDRSAPWIRDRSGGQTLNHISVVGGRLGYFGSADRTAGRALAGYEAVAARRRGLR